MPEENDFDFEDEVAIDLDNLHEEWRTHASIRYKYASEVSHLDRVLRKAGEEIATIKARLIKQCKEENAKVTIQQIDAFCIENEMYITVREKQLDAEYELNMAKNALKAFDDRKSALENEVKLWIANYFSAPTEERQIEPGKSIVAKGRDEASGKARETMNRKRTRK